MNDPDLILKQPDQGAGANRHRSRCCLAEGRPNRARATPDAVGMFRGAVKP
jgi:hypothetical protein